MGFITSDEKPRDEKPRYKRQRDSDKLTKQNPSNKRMREEELTKLKTKIKNQLRTGPGAYLTRSRCAANPVSEITQVITEAEHQHNIEVITSITNCGYFMHIVVLTYSWILWKEQNPNTSSHVKALNNIRGIAPTTFFKPDIINLIKPAPLINSLYKTKLHCYAITKPNSDNTTMVAIAHYFAVLTNGVTGVLYNAYGSDLTKNPGYSMNINLEKFYEFIIVSNDPEGNIEKKKTGYKYYFLRNEIDYWDEEDQVLIKAGVRDEYRNFVVEEPNLRIYEIDGYQKKVQEALEALINAPEPPRGGQKRKSKRKKRSRRTRRRKRTKTRRRRKK